MAQQKYDCRLQDLIEQVVFREFIVLAGQDPFSGQTILNGASQIDFAPQCRNIIPAAYIFTIKSLLELSSDSFCENRGKEIVQIVKLLFVHIDVFTLSQRGESVREHIIDVLYEYALILCH